MASTYSQIASTTLGTATNTVTFSSIPQTYTNLVVICNGSVSNDTDEPRLRFNSDTGSNYSSTTLQGNGSSANSYRYSNITSILLNNVNGWKNNANNTAIWQISNYQNSTTFKTVLGRSTNPSAAVAACAGLWRNTAAITSVSVFGIGSNFTVGSTFTLYGIKGA
jgi:hypothetical protein